jgi:hypothetical protein
MFITDFPSKRIKVILTEAEDYTELTGVQLSSAHPAPAADLEFDGEHHARHNLAGIDALRHAYPSGDFYFKLNDTTILQSADN